MSSPAIVYLDQNYISNITKARLGMIKNDSAKEFWISLFKDMKNAVVANKIACPSSEFHQEEGSFDRRLELEINKTAAQLSYGLEFNEWDAILQTQIEHAAYKFLGKSLPPIADWSIAYSSDPKSPVESRMEDINGAKVRIDVSFSMPELLVKRWRQSKEKWADKAKTAISHRESASWDEELLEGKRAFIYQLFGAPAFILFLQKAQKGDYYDKENEAAKFVELLEQLAKLTSIGINKFTFFDSSELLSIPFIDIFCSIHETQKYYYFKRTPQNSDLRDSAILATVVPYCDIVTTDSFMKEVLVKTLHFDEKYNCKIFSGSEKDSQTLQQLITEISQE